MKKNGRMMIQILGLMFLMTSGWATKVPVAAEVFHLSAQKTDNETLTLNWHILPGFYLYQARVGFEAQPAHAFDWGPIHYPNGFLKRNKHGVLESLYRDDVTISLPLIALKPGVSQLVVHYQGCSDSGFCYPPQKQSFEVVFDADLHLTEVHLASPVNVVQQTDRFYQILDSRHWFMMVLGFLGFGLMLSLTPCVLPMVPVLSGLIVGHGASITKRRAFLLSLCYVLSMSMTYALIGALVAVMGKNLQIIMQSSIAILGLSVMFVALSLSMFGVYSLQWPVRWQSMLARITRSQASGHYLSAMVMGCLSTLILSPCVTAPMLGVLTYIAETGSLWLGVVALFCLGLGMGLPLLLVGLSAGSLLPKAGLWMSLIQRAFGVGLLVMAIQLSSRVLPSEATMFFWALLALGCGVFLGAFRGGRSHLKKLSQALGVVLVVEGVLLLVGAGLGHDDPLHPLQSGRVVASASSTAGVRTVAALEDALLAAQKAQIPVILDFYADWCASCQEMKALIATDVDIQKMLQKVRWIEVDVTANDADARDLMQRYHVVAPPLLVFLDAKGVEKPGFRLGGRVSMREVLMHLQQ